MTIGTVRPDHVPEELVHDFDLEFRGSVDEAFGRLERFREAGPVLWAPPSYTLTASETRGTWVVTRGDLVRHVLQHPDVFSSSRQGSFVPMLPIFLDPPEHTRYRRLLNPLFSPAAVKAMEGDIRARIGGMVDALAAKGSCDFVAEVAVQFPTRVFVSWMGLPESETGHFVALAKAMIHGTADERATSSVDVHRLLDGFVADREAAPADDLMSRIIGQRLDGEPLPHDELVAIAFLLFLAGLDTVAAALSFAFCHLATTPGDRRAVASGEVPVATAVEELLRRHSFVSLSRLVTQDTELGGVHLKAGDFIMVSLPLAGRDPEEYADAAEVRFGRDEAWHAAFGLGPHRCLGSHLARMEMRLALDEWHARIPDYRLGGEPVAYGGHTMGLTTLPLTWA